MAPARATEVDPAGRSKIAKEYRLAKSALDFHGWLRSVSLPAADAYVPDESESESESKRGRVFVDSYYEEHDTPKEDPTDD